MLNAPGQRNGRFAVVLAQLLWEWPYVAILRLISATVVLVERKISGSHASGIGAMRVGPHGLAAAARLDGSDETMLIQQTISTADNARQAGLLARASTFGWRR